MSNPIGVVMLSFGCFVVATTPAMAASRSEDLTARDRYTQCDGDGKKKSFAECDGDGKKKSFAECDGDGKKKSFAECDGDGKKKSFADSDAN
jgi:hypothetical protein